MGSYGFHPTAHQDLSPGAPKLLSLCLLVSTWTPLLTHTPVHIARSIFFFQCRRNEVCDLAKTLPRLKSFGIKPKLLQTWLPGPASTGSLAFVYLPDTSQGFFSLGPPLCSRPLRAGPLQDLQQLRRHLPKEAFPATSSRAASPPLHPVVAETSERSLEEVPFNSRQTTRLPAHPQPPPSM